MPMVNQLSDLGTQLREARLLRGMTLEQVAAALDTSFPTIWRYEAGKRRPSGPTLFALATVYQTTVDGLLGDGPRTESLSKSSSRELAPSSSSRPSETGATLNDMVRELSTRFDRLEFAVRATAIAESSAEYVPSGDMPAVRPVEVNEVAAAAGGGAEVYDETVVGCLWFRNDWLDRHAIDPTQCNIITVRGESMEPTLPDGCAILVDRSQSRRRRREGRIYVMQTEDGLVVKRAGQDEEGNWQIVSDHDKWTPLPWSADIEIIAEVRWSGRTF